ncbi:MAG TPA: hypothetical protein VEM59_05185 [Acidimicrobiia bacterium]|nr:hypothetical protein [Acidimicrobiia bacterium]
MQIAVVAASVALLIVAALVFFLTRGGDDKSAPAKKFVSGDVQLVLGGVQNSNAGAPATLPDDAANQIMQVVGTYVERGLVVPAKTGEPPQNLGELFDAGSQAAINGPDKGVLFETGEPKRTGDFKPAASPVVITALSDNGGQFVLATAAFDYSAEIGVKGGALQTARSIALTLSPESGAWKITGYDVTVNRQGAEVDVPTATAQG